MPVESVHPYEVGDCLVTTGQKIGEIVGQSNSSGVYITEDGHIRWEYYADERVPDRLQTAIRKFESLALAARRSFPTGKREDVRRELACALRSALEMPEGVDPLKAFEDFEAGLNSQYTTKAATQYAAGCASSALILWTMGIFVYQFTPVEGKAVVVGAIAGTAGALVSVLLKIKTLKPGVSPLWFWCVEGFLRTLLGLFSGALLVILAKANIVVGFAAQNAHELIILSVAAGFSERLVPNILTKIERGSIDGKIRGNQELR